MAKHMKKSFFTDSFTDCAVIIIIG